MHVVVVGAGIAGLAAARALVADESTRVTVLEGSGAVGGKLRTSTFAGVDLDEGAEQVLVRTPEAIDLITSLGLGDDLVHPRTNQASVWTRGRLRPLPAGTLLGVPGDPVAVMRAGVLSGRGLARVAADALLPRVTLRGDVAVGAHVARRMGREVVDRLVDPLLGGVYAGRGDQLSLQATVPALAATVQDHRTLLGAVRAARKTAGTGDGPVFAGVRGGLGRVASALSSSLNTNVRTNGMVRELTRLADGRLEVVVGDTRVPERVIADAVVLALPARPASRLLATLAPGAAREVGRIDYASTAIVSLAYRRADVPRLPGSGFLVPAVERSTIKAVTFASQKWAHLDQTDLVFLRASVGRYGEQHDLQRDDDSLVTAVAADVARMTAITAPRVDARVSRWGGALPQYLPGHLELLARVRRALPTDIALCGAAYDGVGVPACIRSGEDAARGVLAGLRQSTGGREEEGA